jgi:type IV pilus assembly protein PilY1
MKNNVALIGSLVACGIAAALCAQPALAQVVSINPTPLASAGGNVLPNLMFTLDDSGSMANQYNPDYVAGSGMCLSDGSNTTCNAGDPPFVGGGEFGLNGVGYDPNFSYLTGVNSDGTFRTNAPSGNFPTPITTVTNDPFRSGQGTTDLTSAQPDIRYCNANTICMKPGQTDSSSTRIPAGLSTSVLVGGGSAKDDTGTTMGAGQFPYRATATNKSFGVVSGVQTNVIALPEMMQIGTFVRNTKNNFIGSPTTTVKVTTVEQHGLAGNGSAGSDAVYTTTGTSNLNVTCVLVTKVDANNFTYNSTSSTAANTTGSWRKCTPATFTRSSNVTTVTGTGNGLVIKDQVAIVASDTTFNTPTTTPAGAAVTAVATDTFKYANNAADVTTAVNGFYVRIGLYNQGTSSTNNPGVAYRIVPIEFCADATLTDCIQILPNAATPTTAATAPADHPFPAFVRFCRTQEEAVAHGPVTFIPGTPRVNRCQAKFMNQSITGVQQYTFARFGLFVRDTIVSSTNSYPGRPNRTDCAASPVCTYNEEMQNYAKWFAYYRSRMLMMKTSVGISFRSFVSNPTGTPPRPDSLRIGLITIHAGDTNPINTAMYLRINNFNTTQASSLYSKFYALTPGQGTPLREALSRTGWIFAGKVGLSTGLTAGIPAADDPVQSSCQKNYALLTTDGFWNGNGGQDIAGNALTNWDNVDGQIYTPPGISPAYTDAVSSRGTGTYDGVPTGAVDAGTNTTGGTSGTLADVALYYYMTDLRGNKDKNNKNTGPSTSPATTPSGGDVATNNVPSKPGNKDFALHQHMVTYTLGLADGLMSYDTNYEKGAGDFANIKSGVTNTCFWVAANAPCDWPVPVHDEQSALDDLWHAAVNGRGTYFQATNPRSLSNALSAALTGISATDGSAAAAATSSPNITPKDNFAFSTTYQSNTWSGIVKAQKIDPVSGVTLPTVLWRADTQLLSQVAATSDARNIFMTDPTATSKLKPFLFGSMTSTEQAFFTKHCTTTGAILSQCATALGGDISLIENGSALVNFLRGQTGNEVNATTGVGVFRDRTEVNTANQQTLQTILGDIVDATPAYIRVPEFSYTDTGYSAFKLANTNRPGTLYVAANDGLLHAFDNATDANGNTLGAGQTCPQSLPVVAPAVPVAGCENWAYMPKFVMPNIWQIADTHYTHRYQLDGSPEIGDVFDVGAGVWKTIIVGGANGGARGYYALDITDPRNPKGLWEFCSDVTLCPNTGTISHSDPDLGFTYGNPVIGKQLSDGHWVVILTSGLNNASPGTGVGFFFVLDAITGQVLSKVSIGIGSTGNPSNLMKHAGFYKAGLVDATISFVYGGDLQGNVWRMDMSTNPPTLTHMATLRDAGGNAQPITVRPVATNLNTYRIFYVGTGRYISPTDPSDTSQQTIYGFKDKDADYGTNIRTANLVVQTLGVGNSRTITNNTVDWATQDGFLIDLNPGNDSPGERIIIDPRLELGTLIFASNVPATGAGCSPGGNSFTYNFDYSTGSYVPGTANGIAGVSQGVFLVGITPIQTTDGSIRTINTDSSGGLGTGTVNINKNPTGVSRFSYRER